MKHVFTAAIWMFLLFGYLHARPVCECCVDISNLNTGDLDFKFLKTEMTCNDNVTFVSPMQLKDCSLKALGAIKDGLEHARQNCPKNLRIYSLLETLDYIPEFSNLETSSNFTTSEGTRKKFAEFVEDSENFFYKLKEDAA